MKKCSKCNQAIPEFDEETLMKFKTMCNLWIGTLLTEKTKGVIGK